MTDRFRPDAALRGIVPLPTRNMVRDPSVARAVAAREMLDTSRAAYDPSGYFEDRGPIGHKGRNSIPRSHRGEGFNYVD